ncbi:hypothetical protein SNE40_018547 [Patella caerulea]|uniref:POPDC1-3 domain-containing protein n=2 Tax=Patella caerulea TaxID=87958 RepID=A0AAN8J5R5_PATCE
MLPATSTVFTETETNLALEKNFTESCEQWQDAQHTLLQLANLCLAISFFTPSNFRFHSICLRSFLLIGFLLFILWSSLLVCMPDVLGWHIVFSVFNLCHMIFIGYKMIPVKLHHQLEVMYKKLFRPMHMTRKEFAEICKLGSVITLAKGSLYAVQGITPCGEKISILVKGRLKVTYNRLFLHFIECNQFVDSPELDSMTYSIDEEEKYQVSITASEDSCLITWHFPTLQNHLSNDPYLETMFHHIVGKDISNKLYQIQELLLVNPDYMCTLASRQSSMVNIRHSLVTQDSSMSLLNFNNMNMAADIKHLNQQLDSAIKSCHGPKESETRV